MAAIQGFVTTKNFSNFIITKTILIFLMILNSDSKKKLT